MNDRLPVSTRGATKNITRSPVQNVIEEIRALFAHVTDGSVADYIPQLGTADPGDFGIAMATVDGKVYTTGDADKTFTIQSISKPFMYAYALREYPQQTVLNHVGVEPTGEAFNAIVLDEKHNRPFNPMVNAGAIAIAELMKGETRLDREHNMLRLFGQFAGRQVDIDEAVYQSEAETGHRNRAIAYMMLNTGMISRDPEDVLDLYFKQCSIIVSCRDLAIMAATLANGGANPQTGEQVIGRSELRDVLTVMHSCGMYNYAGQWGFEVGLPAKSGVSGGIVAVVPGQLGLGVYSPPLDDHGNSVRGVQVCREVSSRFGLHVFAYGTGQRSIIRREYRADQVRSKRLRTPQQIAALAEDGRRIAVVELQGAIFFGSAEQLIRRLAELGQEADWLILDFRRAHVVEASSAGIMRQMLEAMADHDFKVAIVLHADGDDAWRQQFLVSTEIANIDVYEECDDALETFENALLSERPELEDPTRFAFQKMGIFAGLSDAEYRVLEQEVQVFSFEAGDTIMREGDEAALFYVIARGSVSIQIALAEGRRKRVACIGPGLPVGEMALIDGGRRSADVVADEAVTCYGFSVDRLKDPSHDCPSLIANIMSNLSRSLSERLRSANDEISSLDR